MVYDTVARSNAARRGWGKTAQWELTPDQEAFLDFLVDPDPDKGSMRAWAERHDVAYTTVANWKKNAKFRDAWDDKLRELNISPERTQTLIDTLYEQGTKGDVKAIELYMKMIDRIKPPTVVVQKSASDLTDEELAAALQSRLQLIQGGDSVYELEQ